jgi:hypothetical protein
VLRDVRDDSANRFLPSQHGELVPEAKQIFRSISVQL